MIQEYKSSIERLAKLFKQSRDRWKQRALELQKKLRVELVFGTYKKVESFGNGEPKRQNKSFESASLSTGSGFLRD